jgi:SAM-dependent methyltransferase
MTTQQVQEVAFWKGLHSQLGEKGFAQLRDLDFVGKTSHFPSFGGQEGLGLDVGCGLVSILEGTGKHFMAVDPLIEEYRKILPLDEATYHAMLDGKVPDENECFDWVLCVNVIDHTPDVPLLVSEMHRVLKPGGKLFFEVNFDDRLSPCHYALWDESMVAASLSGKFEQTHRFTERNEPDKQSLYHAEYTKI